MITPHAKRSKLLLKSFLIICCGLFLFGCAKSSLVSSMFNPAAEPLQGPIFIIGVFHNSTTHKIYEDSLAEHFAQNGIKAYVSHNYGFGTSDPDHEKLKKAMAQTKSKEVFFTHLVDEKIKDDTVATISDRRVYATYWDNVYGYHTLIYERTFAPEEHNITTTDYMEATIFDWESGKQIWTAHTKSKNLNPYLREDDNQLENLFITSLKKDNLL